MLHIFFFGQSLTFFAHFSHCAFNADKLVWCNQEQHCAGVQIVKSPSSTQTLVPDIPQKWTVIVFCYPTLIGVVNGIIYKSSVHVWVDSEKEGGGGVIAGPN